MNKIRSKRKISRLALIGGLLLIVAAAIFLGASEEKIDFVFSENPGLWQVSGGTAVRKEGDSIQLTGEEGAFYIAIPNMNLDADWYDVCLLEMKLPVAYDRADLFFLSPYNRRFDRRFTLTFDTGRANRFNRLWVDLKKHGAWQGIVHGVLIIPGTNSKTADLRRISFIHANLKTKILAWWSDFIRYYDPLLGTCFAMASPYFIKGSYNSLWVPFLWGILGLVIIVLIGSSIFALDERIRRNAVAVFFLILILAWGLLDLRNNVYYLKAMRRDINLYWGKTLQEKREIATGSPEFIKFLKFCDESIPLDGKIFNFVPREIPGTPVGYLSEVQLFLSLRPRYNEYFKFSSTPRHYYIFYDTNRDEVKEVFSKQDQVFGSVFLNKDEEMYQEISLWKNASDISQISFKIKTDKLDKESLSVSILSEDGRTLLGKGEFTELKGEDAVFSVTPIASYGKRKLARLRIVNTGERPIEIAVAYSCLYPDGRLVVHGKDVNWVLAFRVYYNAVGFKVFKKYSERAFILTE